MPLHEISRVRYEARWRKLTVIARQLITPRMLRLSFTSHDLVDFRTEGADDHVKLFLPAGGPDPEQYYRRDFTPRRFDAEKGVLDIDFALHEAGPAITWAKNAELGDTVDIGGPKGSILIPNDFSWYLFIGDETALPAIGRRIEELPAGVRAISFVVIEDKDEIQTFETKAELETHWITRNGGGNEIEKMEDAIDAFSLPSGDGFVWIASEVSLARRMRDYIVSVKKHPEQWLKAKGYWQRGVADED